MLDTHLLQIFGHLNRSGSEAQNCGSWGLCVSVRWILVHLDGVFKADFNIY